MCEDEEIHDMTVEMLNFIISLQVWTAVREHRGIFHRGKAAGNVREVQVGVHIAAGESLLRHP